MNREELTSQVETLSHTVNGGTSLQETLRTLEPEVAKAMDSLNALWCKRRELLGKLAAVEQAKKDLVATKEELAALPKEGESSPFSMTDKPKLKRNKP